ncbi:hypothetical protein PAHAL_1G424500 [Panicum hallii]|uniref:Uncharacterized protein n=1 Tax=Panicum hallii TaxID=206008 RepID=A0A2T8KY34_9POAL|nr:hypothetical protein PAHAL_1G424500 [Panicum hallii]
MPRSRCRLRALLSRRGPCAARDKEGCISQANHFLPQRPLLQAGLPCLPYLFRAAPNRAALEPACLPAAAASACGPAPQLPSRSRKSGRRVPASTSGAARGHGTRTMRVQFARRPGSGTARGRSPSEGSRRRPGRRATTPPHATCGQRPPGAWSRGGKARLPRWVELEPVALCSPRRAASSGGAACGGT